MKVLVACEFSGIVREAFKREGWDAWSCDFLPTEIPGQHIQDDVLNHFDDGWDMMIAFPPCTHLAVSGARYFKDKKKEQEEAKLFFMELVFRYILASLPNPEDTVMVGSTGCTSLVFPMVAVHNIHSLFGNQNAIASGLK